MTTTEPTALPWWKDRLLLGVAVVFVGWSALAVTLPLSGDAGVFAWLADTAHRGGAPYVDAWDTKGPAAWLPSLLVQSIAGRTAWAIRVFDIAMLLAALVALRVAARRLGQPGAGRIAIALYVLWYTSLDYWQSAQPDGWVAAWLIVATALAMAGGPLRMLVAGALIGLCTMVKPFYLGFLVVCSMIVLATPGQPVARRARDLGVILLGFSAAVTLQLLALRQFGALDGFFEVQRWNRDVYAGLGDPWLTRIPAIFKGSLLMPWGIVGPIALFGAIRPTRAHRRAIAALTVGFLGAIAGVMLQGKGWTYHWLPMLPFLALLADIGFAALRTETAGEIAGRFRWLALLLAFAIGGITPLQQFYRFARSRGSIEAREQYERHEFRYYGRQAGSVYAIVDSLASLPHTGPDAPAILVWAMQPGPQVLRGARIPTRFAVIRPLFDGAGTEFRARYRAQFEADLRRAPPRWWLHPTPELLASDDELRSHDIRLYLNAATVLHDQYRVAGQTAEWMIYERVSADSVSATR
ncbi:MAG: hypothetical protein H7099_13315 [Gemmatimonadaceae bacterium]|nr:hypothetical protein [Gemmatimonadaceae bacterium]